MEKLKVKHGSGIWAAFVAAIILPALLISSCGKWRPEMASSPKVGINGMVSSAHHLASKAGADVLRDGGNAVDAAVATAFALSVVEPYSSGIGGGGFMLIYGGEGDKVEVLDYREVAPALAGRDMYLKDGRPVPGLSVYGPLASGVPGTAAGLCEALEKRGTMDRKRVMAPAIALAEDGFKVDQALYQRVLLMSGQLWKDKTIRKIFLKGGLPPMPGTVIKQPELARTLRSIAEKGPSVFYEGEIARAIASDMEARGGLISLDDLAAYKPRWREPLRGTYRGCEVVSMPPPSSGGAAVIEVLNILEGYDLASLGYGSVASAHYMAEAMRMAFADRSAYMGDPAFVDVPVETLTSKEYARYVREKIDSEKATPSRMVTPGQGYIDPPQAGEWEAPLYAAASEGNHTTHLSVVDKSGGAVSLTQTINTVFGACYAIEGTGIVMNNEMDDFAAVPGEPNAFGLVQGEANAVAPGKIPLSSMSPTMLFKDGRLFMVIGSPGGPRIITTVIQTIVNVVDFGMDAQEAVTAPRLHHQWLPDQLYVDRGLLPVGGKAKLRERGHVVKNYIVPCNAQMVLIGPDGELAGGSDPRGVGEPEGY